MKYLTNWKCSISYKVRELLLGRTLTNVLIYSVLWPLLLLFSKLLSDDNLSKAELQFEVEEDVQLWFHHNGMKMCFTSMLTDSFNLPGKTWRDITIDFEKNTWTEYSFWYKAWTATSFFSFYFFFFLVILHSYSPTYFVFYILSFLFHGLTFFLFHFNNWHISKISLSYKMQLP